MLPLAASIGFKQLYRAVNPFARKRYKGDAESICEQVVNDCWKGGYFLGSAGHYSQFWARDFGLCAEALYDLGWKQECHETLSNALKVFEKGGLASTIIAGRPVNIGYYCPDSLAWLAHAVRVTKYDASGFSEFFRWHANEYFASVLDRAGLIRSDRPFSAIKGGYERESLLYNNVMTAMLSDDLTALGFRNPFEHIDFRSLISNRFWTGDSFRNDLARWETTGDANIFPYWCGVEQSQGMLERSLEVIRGLELDKPFPLMYKRGRTSYQVNTAWTNLGPVYMELVGRVDRELQSKYMRQYEELIEWHGNYLECFDAFGRPFWRFYAADEGMLWAANFLKLLKGI
ncbi:MAG: hypothetical protein JW834_01120 [Candidatus Diapherotrites archaeon]|nr:hypothetical protein [Candidatus Diapherotrites archaeon]